MYTTSTMLYYGRLLLFDYSFSWYIVMIVRTALAIVLCGGSGTDFGR